MYQFIKKINSRITILSILVIQFLLCYYAFYDILTYPNKYIFNSIYDGLKNYYVLTSYVNNEVIGDFLHFTGYNYPYGENIFFIDNTPIFSIFYKFLVSNHIINSANLIYHYNLFFIICVFLSSLVSYKIVKKFSSNNLIIALVSLSTPWICQQINRLALGHFNLSISLYLLLCVLILINIYQNNKLGKNYFKNLLFLYVLIIISSFTHFYYFPILFFFSSSFFLLHFIQKFYTNTSDKLMYLFSSTLTLLISAFTVYYTINYFDVYASERLPSANGYNWIEWKLNIHAFLSPNVYNNIKYIVSSAKHVPLESNAYLGSGTLYILTTIVLMFLYTNQRKLFIQYVRTKTDINILIILFISTIICLLISIGPDYSFNDNEYYLTNYLNPFFYIVDFFPIVEQFRCLARFSWPFVLVLQLSVVIFAGYLYDKNNILKYLTIVFLLFNFSNALDTVKFYHQNYFANPLYEGNTTIEFQKMLDTIKNRNENYQAILTIPFYHSGSEDYNYTIDPNDDFATSTMQLAHFTSLPLISSKMGRTSINQTKALFNIYLKKDFPPQTKEKLNSNKILIYVDRAYESGKKNWPINEREPALTAHNTRNELLKSKNCTKIYQFGDIELYEMVIIK